MFVCRFPILILEDNYMQLFLVIVRNALNFIVTFEICVRKKKKNNSTRIQLYLAKIRRPESFKIVVYTYTAVYLNVYMNY